MSEDTAAPSEAPGESAAPVAPGGDASAADLRRVRRTRRTRLRLTVVFAVLAAAVVFLLVEGLGSSLDYFDTVSQAMAHRSELGTTVFRLEGTVAACSIRSTTAGADFTIVGGGKRITVVNTGAPPQLFQPTIPVVVVGHFVNTTSDVFESNQILVKHSETYVAKHPTRVKPKSHASGTRACAP